MALSFSIDINPGTFEKSTSPGQVSYAISKNHMYGKILILGLPIKRYICLRNFDLSIIMALVNGGYVHCTDIKKVL